jgi:hypothetical protein
METLEPFNISADNGKNDSNDADRSMSEYPYPYPYPPSDLPYQYIK